MSANGFHEDELVTRKVKVGNEWQTRTFPVVGGRLRLVHEDGQHVSIQTEIVRFESDFVGMKAMVTTEKGLFHGTGTASAQRDAKLADSLVELAETRSIARALRFAGYGMEYTGAEEVSHVAAAASEKERSGSKQPAPVFPEDNGNGKVEAKAPRGAPAETGSRPQTGSGIGTATQAQVRALFALSHRANYHEADIGEMLARFEVSRFEDLSRESASQLIGHLQTQVAA
ncbi:MAG: hypothetical protein ACLP5H_11685 [Desulfomonilaceae bacterium]